MIMLDSSIWIAYMNKKDSCHDKAFKILAGLNSEELEIYEHTYEETLNVLRNKTSSEQCQNFIRFLKDYNLEITIGDEHVLSIANTFFFEFSKLSFSDCLLMSASLLNNSQLISFDKEMLKAWSKVSKWKVPPQRR